MVAHVVGSVDLAGVLVAGLMGIFLGGFQLTQRGAAVISGGRWVVWVVMVEAFCVFLVGFVCAVSGVSGGGCDLFPGCA